MTAVLLCHSKGNIKKSPEHNSVIEANTSSEAGTSSEEGISLSFQRWNLNIITQGIAQEKQLRESYDPAKCNRIQLFLEFSKTKILETVFFFF